MSSRRPYRDPEKRAAKRARQRASGYQGVKKQTPPAIMHHNSGRMDGSRDVAKARQEPLSECKDCGENVPPGADRCGLCLERLLDERHDDPYEIGAR